MEEIWWWTIINTLVELIISDDFNFEPWTMQSDFIEKVEFYKKNYVEIY